MLTVEALQRGLELGAQSLVMGGAIFIASVPRSRDGDNKPPAMPGIAENQHLFAFEVLLHFRPKDLDLNLDGAALYSFVDRRICTVLLELICTVGRDLGGLYRL